MELLLSYIRSHSLRRSLGSGRVAVTSIVSAKERLRTERKCFRDEGRGAVNAGDRSTHLVPGQELVAK